MEWYGNFAEKAGDGMEVLRDGGDGSKTERGWVEGENEICEDF